MATNIYLVAVVSQNLGFNLKIMVAMPATGISTLSILLLRKLIVLKAYRVTSKIGVAARLGSKETGYIFLLVQLIF